MRKLTTILSLVILGTFFYYNHAVAQAQDGVQVNQEAPAFDLLNIDGNHVALDDYTDENGVIVIFTCNHCPYSKLYEDRIIAIDKEFKEMGYPVVAINPNDPEVFPSDDYETMKVRAEEKGFTFPYLVDETQEVAQAYGATRTPHVFLLNREQDRFMVRYIGAIDDNARNADKVDEAFLKNAIESLQEGQDPNPAETKAIGCTIKWKKS